MLYHAYMQETQWVISSMVLEAGVGVDNQKLYLQHSRLSIDLKSHSVKVRAYIWLLTRTNTDL